ncbi:MAG: DUF4118 domain-containing protein [Geobacteraceae bacterium]|nr:DUF4118 domain-containing protein [Geobacteraceae bacterium]
MTIADMRAIMRLERQVNCNLVDIVSLLVLLLIGWLDYITGYEFGFFIFYFIPVAIAAWFCGRSSGLAIAFASAFVWYISDKYTHHPYSQAFFIYWEMFMRLISFLTTAFTVSRIRDMLLKEERLNAELRAALQQVQDLRSKIADPETFK